MEKKLKENEFLLLKSKDDYSHEHYSTSPLSKLTGFIGTAGEGIINHQNKITLFVDPRYHIQAEIQTKGKDVTLVKMVSQYDFISYLKNNLKKNDVLYIPSKSSSLLFYEKVKKELEGVKIETYLTEDDENSIDDKNAPVFSVPVEISGLNSYQKTEKIKIDNFLITNTEEIAYLLNLRSYKTKNMSTFRSKLFIKNKNEVYLFVDYELPKMPDFIKVLPTKEFENFIKKINENIYIDKNSISLFDFDLIKSPVAIKKNPVSYMASVKNKKEISHYKDSFKRLDYALFSFREKIKEGLSEFELNEIFEKELKKEGANCTSFKTILAIDDNSSIIHYTASSKEKILKKGGIILLDCGGYYEGGYATDITRVFYCKGKAPSDILKEIYTAVLKAQLNVYHSAFLTSFENDALAKKILKKYEKKGFLFPHGLGHGIGIPVHQFPPVLSDKVKIKLKNGNVFTIEPGLYKEGQFGIRLENTVYLDKNKKISLSHFPYEDSLINFDMLNKKELKQLSDWQKEAERI